MRFPAFLVLAAFFACVRPARAADDDYRRPGLEGMWARRHITAPTNSLNMLFGPGQPQLFGQRFAEQNVDGGGQFIHHDGAESETWLRAGAVFGLTKNWEAGALFLPFRFTPDFDYSQITVFATSGYRFEDWDLGFRISFQTPRRNEDDKRVWVLNPGIPVLVRAGRLRFDGAVLLPFALREWKAGLTVPLRATVNLDAHVFFGVESGFAEPRFDYVNDATIPLGALAGYTALFGNRVVDFTGMFSWDSFFLPNPESGKDAIDAASYRIGFGVVIHSLVR